MILFSSGGGMLSEVDAERTTNLKAGGNSGAVGHGAEQDVGRLLRFTLLLFADMKTCGNII